MENNVINIAHRWWQAMCLPEKELKSKGIMPAPTAQKARLKRCDSVGAAMLSDGFRSLWLSLPEELTTKPKPENIECWAAIAAALAFVKTDTGDNLAKAAGRKGEGGKSIVSELRFAQLQNAKTPDDFLRRLRRILQQLDGATSVRQLILDIHQWFKERNYLRPQSPTNRIAVRWAMDYYQAAK